MIMISSNTLKQTNNEDKKENSFDTIMHGLLCVRTHRYLSRYLQMNWNLNTEQRFIDL